MLMRSHSERRALLGFTALLTPISPTTMDRSTPFASKESIFTSSSPSSLPPWVAQALTSLEQSEHELQSLRERQQAEVEEVNRQLDSAVLEAQREERRLLEKVEQDHREAQRQMSQVKRENAAAVRVMESLVDHQLRKVGQLREQIQRCGHTAGGANKNQLQRGVAELTQPWEISVTLKRLEFTPGPHSKSSSLGEVDVQEQCMTYPIGVCGVQGQKCALHSGENTFSKMTPLDIRREPQPIRGGQRNSPDGSSKKSRGNMRVVRKLFLSSSTENEEELKAPKSPGPQCRGASESSQDEEGESVCSDNQGPDLFLAYPSLFSQGESEGDESDEKQNGTKKRSTTKAKRKQKTSVMVPCEEPSWPPEENNGRVPFMSPEAKHKASLSRPSPTDLSSRNQKKTSSPDSGSPTPVDSDYFCDTYTVTTPVNRSLKEDHCPSISTADVSGKLQKLVNNENSDSRGLRKVNQIRLVSEPSTLDQIQAGDCEKDDEKSHECISIPQTGAVQGLSRSLSMSAIEDDKSHQAKEGQEEKTVSGFGEIEEDVGSKALDCANLLKQFGKQGSGRTDFNLPSGIHATARGQLFVVDCGNARIQVTDLQKNVVQQVSPSGSDRSSRICNYFDVAVNTKGLIAMTCAAQRAVLIFSRHGRLLQTFGGTMIGSTNEDLDAPRGVTVDRHDDFLVTDIKHGTITALKLDTKTGARLERTVVTGYHRPYLVAACLTTGLMAVSERGNETGRVPCIRVLEPGWNTIRILGVCSGLGPILSCPWGLCIDSDGDVLVADWGKQHHRVLIYPSKGVGWPLVTDSLSSPRGLALLPGGHMVVSDSMNHCLKIYQYKETMGDRMKT
ncbi:uncharacterized protein LOC114474657 [Gouania willdenowi]|uniref:Uncharacterized LOC114474657 n=1 Tax=Gouania willdenowi TaxID=441366 RepID=A0A8C5DZ91_GOUWI|nr:uncharacterized protein LOC114474657 [Gouania willdenowi]